MARVRSALRSQKQNEGRLLTVWRGSVATKHTVSAQGHSRCGTNDTVRVVGLSGNDTSDVGAVTTAVERIWVREGNISPIECVSNEIVAERDQTSGTEAASERRMTVINL